ncbi:PP0621 family protein [Thiolapillus sp.]
MKTIFLLIAVLLIWWVLRTLRRERTATVKPKIKNMLSCRHCGLHIPEDEAVRCNNRIYCSKEHAQKDNP